MPLWIGLLLPFLIGLSFLLLPGILKAIGWLVILIGIATCGLILALTYPMYYEITPTTLVVRSGLLRVQIALNSIQQVTAVRHTGTAPAWSFDRLRIDYRTRWRSTYVHIALKDRFKFMQDLVEHTEGLEVKDGKVLL